NLGKRVAAQWKERVKMENKALERKMNEMEWNTLPIQSILHCNCCEFSTQSGPSLITHLSIHHHSTLLQQHQLLRCHCCIYVRDEEKEREHRERCPNVRYELVNIRKNQAALIFNRMDH
ncbi:hypothetical protein PENTCL1PPCAC_26973, partial [Pristionchus entomophagus]